MKRVGEIDAHIEERLEFYRKHLERCRLEFDSILASGGMEAALRGQASQNLAQYGEVVRVLEEVSLYEPLESLSRISSDAVEALRDSDTPRWRSLALATVLEALVASA